MAAHPLLGKLPGTRGRPFILGETLLGFGLVLPMTGRYSLCMARCLPRMTVVMAAAFALTVTFASAAFADCHADGVNSGDDVKYVGPGTSSEEGAWDLGAKAVKEFTDADFGMSTSKCLDTYVDWATTSGHYDQRLTRVCQPGGWRLTDQGGDGWALEPSDWGGRTVTGLQKGAGCLYNQSTGNFDDCSDFPEHLSGCVYDLVTDSFTLSYMKWFTRWWVTYQDGTIAYNSGGDVASNNS